jgi:DNA-binding transcriptional LysR family regulator
MELRDIKSFIGVADHKSFTKAAEHSYLSQPSLSKAVKKLEDELHVELFDRSTRYLHLTDAGQIVYIQGKKALAALTELTTLLDELTDAEVGEIKMGIPPLIGTLFFPNIARLFHDQYPNVTLELIEMGAKVIEQLVKDDQIDVGLIVLPVDETVFNIYPFITDDFVLCTHQGHPLARKRSVSLSQLKDEKFIVFSEHFSLHDHIINACKEAGFTPSISYESSQWDLILELVASKLGIALLPNSIFEKQNNPSIKTIPLQAPSLLWKLGVITKKESYHSFALRKLLEIIKKDLN